MSTASSTQANWLETSLAKQKVKSLCDCMPVSLEFVWAEEQNFVCAGEATRA